MNRSILLLTLTLYFCGGGQSNGIEVKSRDLNRIHIQLDGYKIDDLARYISGRPTNLPEKFQSLTATPAYAAYAARTREGWNRYNSSRLETIRKWRDTELKDKVSPRIFYPFGGPDILHPLVFFEDFETMVMIGLEPAGSVPLPTFANPTLEMQRLPAIFRLVSDVWGRNFYRTIWMRKDFGHSDYRSISTIILFGLGLNELEVLDGYNVRFTSAGELVPAEAGGPVNGIRYVFRKPGSDKRRTVTYISTNISDGAISATPGLAEFLGSVRDVTTMLKAASYLMHQPQFDDIRSTILSGSRSIITDSSGLPFHYLNNDKWDIQLYGRYSEPIPLFRGRVEPDLRRYYGANPSGALPFHYGYSVNPSHVVLAMRKKGVPFTKPKLDLSDSYGENTAGGHVSRNPPPGN